MWCLIFFFLLKYFRTYLQVNEGNVFTTPFIWIFGKIQFFENCRRKFYFCRREIDCITFRSAFFCRHKIYWVLKRLSYLRRVSNIVYLNTRATLRYIITKIWQNRKKTYLLRTSMLIGVWNLKWKYLNTLNT